MSKACWMAFSSALWLDPPCTSIASAAGCVGLHMAASIFNGWKELSVKRLYCFSFSGRRLYRRASSPYVTFYFDDDNLKFLPLWWFLLTSKIPGWFGFLFELAVWSTQPTRSMCDVWQGLSLWTSSPVLAGSQLAEEAVLQCQSFLRLLKFPHKLLLSQVGCNRPGILCIPDAEITGLSLSLSGCFLPATSLRTSLFGYSVKHIFHICPFLIDPRATCMNHLPFHFFKILLLFRTPFDWEDLQSHCDLEHASSKTP